MSVTLVACRCSLKPARGSSRSSRKVSSKVRHHQEAKFRMRTQTWGSSGFVFSLRVDRGNSVFIGHVLLR